MKAKSSKITSWTHGSFSVHNRFWVLLQKGFMWIRAFFWLGFVVSLITHWILIFYTSVYCFTVDIVQSLLVIIKVSEALHQMVSLSHLLENTNTIQITAHVTWICSWFCATSCGNCYLQNLNELRCMIMTVEPYLPSGSITS